MLPWQLKLISEKNLNFSKILLFSLFLHLFIFSFPFLFVRNNSKIIDVSNINLNSYSAIPVTFSNKVNSKFQTSKMANKVEPTSEKKIIEKKSKKKEKFFKTKLLDDDKKNTKSKKEKIKNKKLEPEKVIKEEPVLKQEIEKFEEQPKVEPKQQVIQEIKTENAEQNIQNFNCVISVQENIEQIDAIQLAVINAIVEHWQRPIGFAKDLSCKFKIKISQDGKIEEIICQELTGIPVYDSEARASLMRTNFPRLTWGMELTIKL